MIYISTAQAKVAGSIANSERYKPPKDSNEDLLRYPQRMRL